VKYEQGFYISEDGILHSHRRETLKSYIVFCLVNIRTTFVIITVTVGRRALFEPRPSLEDSARCGVLRHPIGISSAFAVRCFLWGGVVSLALNPPTEDQNIREGDSSTDNDTDRHVVIMGVLDYILNTSILR
jgi:hypothetical protein